MKRLAAFSAIVITLMLTGCKREAAPTPAAAKPASEPFRIGVILPLTGTLAEMGFYERGAMELALRGTAGRNARLIFEDSRSNAVGAVTAANKLLAADKVQLLVTSTTGASLAVQPVAEAANVPLIAFCMDPTVADGHASTVRFYIGIDEETQQVAKFLSRLPKNERVAILHAAVPVWRKVVQSTYVPELTKALDVPPLVEEYNLQEKDFRSILGKIKTHRTTTLVLLGYGFEYPPIYQQLQELGLRSGIKRIVGGWGFLYTPLSPQQLEGTIVAGPQYLLQRNASGAEFAAEFAAATGRQANFDAAFAYELMTSLPALIASGQLTSLTIKPTLQKLGQRQGVVGEYYFSKDGEMIVKTGLAEYRDGKLVPYGGQ